MPLFNIDGWIPDYDEIDKVCDKLTHRTFGQAAPHLTDSGVGETNLLYQKLLKIRGSWPYYTQQLGDCFNGSALVQMADGSKKPISDVSVGDSVITPYGNIKQVTRLIKKPYNGKMLEISVEGHTNKLIATPDHKVIYAKNINKYSKNRNDTEWTEISNLKIGDRIVFSKIPNVKELSYDLIQFAKDPILETDDFKKLRTKPVEPGFIREKGSVRAIKRFVSLDDKLGWLIGLYAAEGSGSVGDILYNLSSKEMHIAKKIEQYIDQIFGLPVLIYQVPSKPTVLYVKIVNKIFAAFMKSMCSGITYTKTLHKDLKICDINTKIGIIDGWKKCIGVSVCESLIKDMFDLCLSVGINSTIGVRKAYKRSKQSYNLQLNSVEIDHCDVEKLKFSRPISKGMIDLGKAVRIKSIRHINPENDFVYCLEVEDDHSFICDGFAVHNCVAHGAARSVMLLMAAEIVNGDREIYAGDISSEDLYGGSRIETGRGQLGNEEGSVGAWCVQYMKQYGVLTRKLYGKIDLRNYDPTLAKIWGNRGVPDELEQYSRNHTVSGFNQVSSYEEARDAINNDYPIMVCSNQGFRDVRDRQGYGIPSGRWMHCMTFVACHDGKRPALLCDNTSWPEHWISGPKPEWAPDMPDGMFPVDAEIADRMLRQGDSYSIYGFNGYKKRKVNFDALTL